jgi:hypothetical protein
MRIMLAPRAASDADLHLIVWAGLNQQQVLMISVQQSARREAGALLFLFLPRESSEDQ